MQMRKKTKRRTEMEIDQSWNIAKFGFAYLSPIFRSLLHIIITICNSFQVEL